MNMFEREAKVEAILKTHNLSYQKEGFHDGHRHDFKVDNGDGTYWIIDYHNPKNEEWTKNGFTNC